jgi:hypothetical protein
MTDRLHDHTMSNVPDKPAWTDEEIRTLIDFRRRNGRRWKSKLLDLYFCSARMTASRTAPAFGTSGTAKAPAGWTL